MEIRRPRVVIIAGINGAGKTTASEWLLRELGIGTYLDADAMERELPGEGAAIRAGRMMHAEIERLREAAADFAIETTMSGQSLRRTLRDLHAAGYESHLLYLWLPNAHMAVRRVKGRVRMGGHSIPPDAVLRRFLRSVGSFDRGYRPAVAEWRVYHAARDVHGCGGLLIARGGRFRPVHVYDEHAWREIQEQAFTRTDGGRDD
ncbi:MAG TPA: AAA family ATPase [Longimicrobium sp.]|nr:AAA family ATPase [Longimicrobium sp.]